MIADKAIYVACIQQLFIVQWTEQNVTSIVFFTTKSFYVIVSESNTSLMTICKQNGNLSSSMYFFFSQSSLNVVSSGTHCI